MVSKVSIHHGGDSIEEQVTSPHGGQGGKREREREREKKKKHACSLGVSFFFSLSFLFHPGL
jgi:hypothetical protein